MNFGAMASISGRRMDVLYAEEMAKYGQKLEVRRIV